jgi:two-component system, NarL family, sensor histidine kinase DegS
LEGKREENPEKEVTLFRIVQEALNNIRRHSHATMAQVKVLFSPDKVTITIQDNGKGFQIEKMSDKLTADGKLGLLGMKERTQLLNGSFSIQSEPGLGTRISINVQSGRNW